MTNHRPAYDLDVIKNCAREGRFALLSRPFHFILNRYDDADPADVASSVIKAIRKDNFLKSIELKNRPGSYADIYNSIDCPEYPEELWYAKVVMCNGEALLEIWSLNWDGYMH